MKTDDTFGYSAIFCVASDNLSHLEITELSTEKPYKQLPFSEKRGDARCLWLLDTFASTERSEHIFSESVNWATTLIGQKDQYAKVDCALIIVRHGARDFFGIEMLPEQLEELSARKIVLSLSIYRAGASKAEV
jgi:hypothetical protein